MRSGTPEFEKRRARNHEERHVPRVQVRNGAVKMIGEQNNWRSLTQSGPSMKW